jgi:hypothetical protein
MSNFKYLFLFFPSIILSSTAFAQSGLNTRLISSGGSLETLQVEDALGKNSERAKYRFMVQASYDLMNRSMIVVDRTRKVYRFPVINQLHGTDLGVNLLMNSRLLVSMNLPMHYVTMDYRYLQNYTLNQTPGWKVGDLQVSTKFRFSNDQSEINFAVMPYFFLPTRDRNYFVSDDSYGMGGKILVDFDPLPFWSVYGNIGYTYAPHARFLNVDRSKRVELASGTLIRITKYFGLNGEAIGSITFPGFERDQNPISFKTGVRVVTGHLRWFGGAVWDGLRDTKNNRLSVYAGVKVPFGSVIQSEGAE